MSESSLVVLSVVIALIVPWAVSAAMTVLGSAGLSRCRSTPSSFHNPPLLLLFLASDQISKQKPRGPREGPAADPMSPGWNAAKPSGAGHQKNAAEMPLHPQCRCSLYSPFAGKRAGFGDRTAASSTSGAAGAPQPAKGDVKVSHALAFFGSVSSSLCAHARP